VAFRGGSVPELLEDGVTGFIVDDLDAAIDATRQIDRLDRGACRDTFEQRFTVRRMAEQYVELYERVIAAQGSVAA
jgi:glycosyltransferase involved in cell wall biosynthesis